MTDLTEKEEKDFETLDKFFTGKGGEFCRGHKDFGYYCKLVNKQGKYNWHDTFGRVIQKEKEMVDINKISGNIRKCASCGSLMHANGECNQCGSKYVQNQCACKQTEPVDECLKVTCGPTQAEILMARPDVKIKYDAVEKDLKRAIQLAEDKKRLQETSAELLTQMQRASLATLSDVNAQCDQVNHPRHYNEHPSGIECITITRHMNFNIGNAVKYLWRHGLKDTDAQVEDLKKAKWYIDDEIARLEGKGFPINENMR